jgi:hypothetical protein
MNVPVDEVVNAIRWRLGFPVDGRSQGLPDIWDRLHKSSHTDKGVLDEVARCLNGLVEQAIRWRLQLPMTQEPSREDRVLLESLWNAMLRWIQQDERSRSRLVSDRIKRALPISTPPTPTPQWQYKPLPEGEPDRHPEFAEQMLTTPGNGLLVGARVRGKKHKHEGTWCDDWFEVGSEGAWTFIAVADGAGSRRLSRVGARASCVRAAEVLRRESVRLRVPERPSAEFLHKDDQGSFTDPALAAVQEALRLANREAHQAVEAAARRCADDPEWQRLFGRPITLEDLSATLLLAVCTRVALVDGSGEARPANLVVACQIGDGTIAALEADGTVHLIGEGESGRFSGETDFLTSARQHEPGNLARKTFALLGDFRALFVMSDGVADDYFPPDPEVARLYADLVLNGILPAEDPEVTRLLAGLVLERIPSAEPPGPGNVAGPAPPPEESRFDLDCSALTATGPVGVRLRSAREFATEHGLSPAELIAQPALLRAGAADAPLLKQAGTPHERLRLWLDAYQVRGSFDDRTLVVLQPGRDR